MLTSLKRFIKQSLSRYISWPTAPTHIMQFDQYMSESDAYRSKIKRLLIERSGETVLNGSPEHASIINEQMFFSAERTVDILTRRFDPRVFGTNRLVEAAELFAGDKTRKARIVIEETDELDLERHPLYKELKDYDNVEFRYVPEYLRSAINSNFTVMDDDSYRFEKDNTKAAAIACFGATDKTADQLSGYFDLIWERSMTFGDEYLSDTEVPADPDAASV